MTLTEVGDAMIFIASRAKASWQALKAMGLQFLLALDQLGNTIGPGFAGVVWAMVTGERQNVAYSDETLSAHAWRARERGRLWGIVWCPLIDAMFRWQQQDGEVNAIAGKAVTSHCERAYYKERLRRGLPPEYRKD